MHEVPDPQILLTHAMIVALAGSGSPNFNWRSLPCTGGEKPISFRPISSQSSGTQRLRTSQSTVHLVSGGATPDVDPPA
jgi:hypothetical protein